MWQHTVQMAFLAPSNTIPVIGRQGCSSDVMVAGTSASRAARSINGSAEAGGNGKPRIRKDCEPSRSIGGLRGRSIIPVSVARWVGQSCGDLTIHDGSQFIDRKVTLKWNKRSVKRTMRCRFPCRTWASAFCLEAEAIFCELRCGRRTEPPAHLLSKIECFVPRFIRAPAK